ncbi:unnamed protein product [Linum tenue]|uniref:Uncharacterized protein n=1 Tax=Linum tenue TaxID=586396 RepID=A0AAV0JW83_9ROSI|nr:unnamed protein product [Linum tenue]
MPYPSFFYHHPVDASRFHLGDQGPMRISIPENTGVACGPSKRASKTTFKPDGNAINPLLQHGGPSQMDFWGLSAESPHASTLTDDDFLDMTYEQYLEVHSKSIKLNPRVGGKSQATRETSRSKRSKDDSSREPKHSLMTHETSRSKRLDNESNSSDRSHYRSTHGTSRRRRHDDDDDDLCE